MYLFDKLRNHIYSFFEFIPNYFTEKISSIKKEIETFKYTISNLAEANMKLGIYHLYNNNLNDAILRFYLINKFYDKGNKLSYYWLGLAYILKNNYNKALKVLNNSNSLESANLLNFMKNINSVENVPESINILYRNLVAVKLKNNKMHDNINNIPKIMAKEIASIIDKSDKKNTILELGSNVGIFGDELAKIAKNEYEIAGVEIAEDMIKLSNPEDYDQNINKQIEEILSTNTKYDVIVSVCGISHVKNIKNLLTNITKKLNKNGYFAICFRTAKHTEFQIKNFEFSYNLDEILEMLTSINYQIEFEQNVTLFKKDKYHILICSKI